MSKGLEERQNKFVFPGEKLAVIEEFNDSLGSYKEEGIIRSAELGKTNIDIEAREVGVSKSTRELVLPKEGLNVYGEVGSTQRRTANVDIYIIDGTQIYTPYTGVVHISSVSAGYVKNMGLAVRSGDIIRARILNTKNRVVQLSMEGAEYGVVYAYCSRCGSPLELRKTRLH